MGIIQVIEDVHDVSSSKKPNDTIQVFLDINHILDHKTASSFKAMLSMTIVSFSFLVSLPSPRLLRPAMETEVRISFNRRPRQEYPPRATYAHS